MRNKIKISLTFFLAAVFFLSSLVTPAFAAPEVKKDYRKKYGHGYYSKKRGKGHGESDEKSARNKRLAKIREEQAEEAEQRLAEGKEDDGENL